MANENDSQNTDTVENKGSGINWARVAVRTAHGAIDQDATLALCAEELTAAMGEEVDMTEIAEAVEKVFAKLSQGGQAQKISIDLNGLATRALGLLGEVPYGAETQLSGRIKDFVRGESERFVETNGAEGKIHVKRGKDGGCKLATATYVTEYRAFQAKKAQLAAK